MFNSIKRGDIVGIEGTAGRTKTGEFSIRAFSATLLSYCLHILPTPPTNINTLNKDTRYRQRYLDLIVNKEIQNKFKTRSRVINYLRNYLINLGFTEVETPMMNLIPGGAAAKPFETYHNALETKLFMRIAPELFLKMCVVGGLDRVFEIGKNFRNEGVDTTHNPEFSACEFYWAYADYHDLMKFTEDLLSSMVKEITGGYKIKYHPDQDDPSKEVEIDFTPPWPRIPMIKGLEEKTGRKFPKNLNTEETRQFLLGLLHEFKVECADPKTNARMIDKLTGHFLEVSCLNPTFIIDHP